MCSCKTLWVDVEMILWAPPCGCACKAEKDPPFSLSKEASFFTAKASFKNLYLHGTTKSSSSCCNQIAGNQCVGKARLKSMKPLNWHFIAELLCLTGLV